MLPKRRFVLSGRGGSTLIEMMVAVAIIAILVTGIMAIGSHVRTNAQIKNTQSVIRALVAALEEYRNYRGTAGSLTFDFPHPPEVNNIVELYETLEEIPSCRAILEKIPESNTLYDVDGNIALTDAWRVQLLEYIYNGPGNFPTIRSAGPDMQFDTADDILSTEL